jgi:hypothetical protein
MVVSLSPPTTWEPSRVAVAVREVQNRIRILPGISAAGIVTGTMFDEVGTDSIIRVPGRDPLPVAVRFVGGDYFGAIGAKVVAGSLPPSWDQAPDGIVLNQSLAKVLFGDGTAVGQVVLPQAGRVARTVVGVVGDAFERALDELPVATMYVPFREPETASVPVHLVVRADRPVEPESIRATVRSVSTELLVAEVSSIAVRLHRTTRERTFAAQVTSVFGFSGLLVYVFGVSSLVAFVAATRRNETAVRLALGASRADVVLPLVRETLVAALLGALLGWMLAIPALGASRSLLYGLHSLALIPVVSMLGVLFIAAATSIAVGMRGAQVSPVSLLKA